MGLIDIARVVSISVSRFHDSAVHPGGVRTPDVDHDVGDRVTSGTVNDLDVEDEINARLVVSEI